MTDEDLEAEIARLDALTEDRMTDEELGAAIARLEALAKDRGAAQVEGEIAAGLTF